MSRARRIARGGLLTIVLAGMSMGARSADDGQPTSAPASAPPAFGLVFHVPDDVPLYRGVVSFDRAGLADPPMLYPGGPAGALVGVLVQGILGNARRARQKAAMEAEADEIVAPYADTIARLTQRDLLEASLAEMTTVGERRIGPYDAPSTAWVVDYAPVFSMAQDRQAIVLDNVVVLSRTSGGAPTKRTIRVVSATRTGDDAEAFWAANDGRALKAESARLLAWSFDAAVADARRSELPAAPPAPQRTLRYRLGSEERMERAELLTESCDRIVMRTLRGWVMSAPPVRAPGATMTDPACTPTLVAAPS